ncbi:MAG: protease HtpX [Candidatus Arsenophonus melophagi]|nr:protease HtpX [Candidatus Arsenophonus melophagi]
MMRIALFLLTNLSVMFIFGLILSLIGIQKQNIPELLALAGLFGFGGSFISLLISKWMALYSVQGKVIKNPTTDMEDWLLSTAKRQADRAGIRMPEVAIYQAMDINAFATGARRNASLVAVSTGLLEGMGRHEAEAVIAHEISHIANGDMVTLTLLQGVLNTFVFFLSRTIAQLASVFFSNNSHEGETRQSNTMIYIVVSMVLEMVFGIFASIITMWFSRYREFRADAGAAHLVGKEKMIAALQCLKRSAEPQEGNSMIAFCINGYSKSFSKLFSSHPTLDKRIEAVRMEIYFNS